MFAGGLRAVLAEARAAVVAGEPCAGHGVAGGQREPVIHGDGDTPPRGVLRFGVDGGEADRRSRLGCGPRAN